MTLAEVDHPQIARPGRRLLWVLAWLGLAGALLAPDTGRAQSLEEALATAYSTNPTLLSARAQLKAVNEGVPQELSNWRPQVTVNASAGKKRIEPDGPGSAGNENLTPLSAGVNVTQPLYRGGRTVAGTRRAEADVLAERENLKSSEQDVLLDAATSYMDVWRNQSVLELNINNGVGYDIITDQPWVELDASLGLAYQYTKFVSVREGSNVDHDAAVSLNTNLNFDFARGIEWDNLYRLQVAVTNIGNTSHHDFSVLSFEIWGPLDLDISLTWDRTQTPVENSEGETPVPDDLRLSVGLGIDF